MSFVVYLSLAGDFCITILRTFSTSVACSIILRVDSHICKGRDTQAARFRKCVIL